MKRFLPLLLCFLLPAAVGCNKIADLIDEPVEEDDAYDTRYYANMFAYNIMRTYYLWADETSVSEGMDNWTYGEDPVEKVKSLRYKDASGTEVDKWTRLMEDYHGFLGSITGNTKTYGFDFNLYYVDSSHEAVCAVVTFTYADSPAAQVGLRRGDVILTLDGAQMTPDNYADLLNEKVYGSDSLELGMVDGTTVSMTAQEMYENPVQTVRTLEEGGKKFGYLHFTNFTMDAGKDLEEAFRTFKRNGVEELVLDLRYNGGGYTITSAALASMMAPPEVVSAGEVFTKEVYNEMLTEAFKDDQDTCFEEEFTISGTDGKFQVSALEANPGLKKVWVITTSGTASASEALICGLKPYMELSTVGECSYGKFCGGYLIQAQDWFDSLAKDEDVDIDCEEGGKLTEDWGIYVISSRYSDCKGVTLSMPSGIPADYDAEDNPLDGAQLGDPSETMLARVLALSTGNPLRQTTKGSQASQAAPRLDLVPGQRKGGVMVNNPAPLRW